MIYNSSRSLGLNTLNCRGCVSVSEQRSGEGEERNEGFLQWCHLGQNNRGRMISSSEELSAQAAREGKAIILMTEVGDVHYFCCTLCLSLLVMCNLFYSYYYKRERQARDIRQFWGLIMGFLELFASPCAWNTARLSCDWNPWSTQGPSVTHTGALVARVDRCPCWTTAHQPGAPGTLHPCVLKQNPREGESKRRQNFILFQGWRCVDHAPDVDNLVSRFTKPGHLARSFCWHTLLCQISASKESPQSQRMQSVPGSHEFEITLIFCWPKPGPSLFISWLSSSQVILSSSRASLLSLWLIQKVMTALFFPADVESLLNTVCVNHWTCGIVFDTASISLIAIWCPLKAATCFSIAALSNYLSNLISF